MACLLPGLTTKPWRSFNSAQPRPAHGHIFCVLMMTGVLTGSIMIYLFMPETGPRCPCRFMPLSARWDGAPPAGGRGALSQTKGTGLAPEFSHARGASASMSLALHLFSVHCAPMATRCLVDLIGSPVFERRSSIGSAEPAMIFGLPLGRVIIAFLWMAGA